MQSHDVMQFILFISISKTAQKHSHLCQGGDLFGPLYLSVSNGDT